MKAAAPQPSAPLPKAAAVPLTPVLVETPPAEELDEEHKQQRDANMSESLAERVLRPARPKASAATGYADLVGPALNRGASSSPNVDAAGGAPGQAGAALSLVHQQHTTARVVRSSVYAEPTQSLQFKLATELTEKQDEEDERESAVQRKCDASLAGDAAGVTDDLDGHQPPKESRDQHAMPALNTPGEDTSGGTDATGMPARLRSKMENALGADFAEVRVNTGSARAAELGALAFTQGSEVHVAPGQWAPETTKGQELLGHELTHVVQQREGRVRATAQLEGLGLNDEPALESEADAMGARAASGVNSISVQRSSPMHNHGDVMQAVPIAAESEPTDDETTAVPANAVTDPSGEMVSSPEDVSPPVQAKGLVIPSQATGLNPIQRQPGGKRKRSYVPYQIQVTQPLTTDEFKVVAMRQVFGGVIENLEWNNLKESYVPAQSPYTLYVEVGLIRTRRGEVSKAKGFDVDSSGRVSGAEGRAKQFQSAPSSDTKTALMDEIDRRYYEASGTDTKIKASETGKAELWRTIRDEVLFQHDYIANLPPKVKGLIKFSISGRELAPADYEQLFRIAKKIEALPPGAAADYASKITATTKDLSVFEAAIDAYRTELAARQQAIDERTAIHNKLLGLEEVYKLYRRYIAASISEATNPLVKAGTELAKGVGAKVQTAGDMREQLERDLPRYGFSSIAEFALYITKFEQAFEDGAAAIAADLLAKYSGKLYQESTRYQDPAVVRDLYGKLSGYRAQYQEFDKNARVWNEYAAQANRDAEQQRLPGNGQIRVRPPTEEQQQAGEKAKAAKAGAQATIAALSSEYPIFAENDLPVEKRLDKAALAQATEAQLAGVLQAHIAARSKAVGEAREQLEGNHQLIYKMEKLMPAFYTQMDIKPGSIHDQIIRDKMRSDAIAKLVGGILLAIVAIALTVVSMGTATPAILAAGASIGAAGLSVYMAYDEYKQYTAEKAIADVGFADDPSVVWLVLAIVGAGVDMAVAVKAVRALVPAAKALEAGGELSDFTKAVNALQKSKQLDEKIAAAANKAAAARKSYAAAKGELSAALSKVYSLPGPLLDPDVYRALVKMAAAKIKQGAYSLTAFIDEVRQARIAAKLGEMTPEELLKAKAAYAEGLEASKVGTYDTQIKWGIQTVEARRFGPGFWGKRTAQVNARVNAYELKINPNNESFFLPHPSGGYVQFENLAANAVQDGKLVMSPKSIYHVAEMPPFARASVLDEARRQLAAAQKAGFTVEWLVSEQKALTQLADLFKAENIPIVLKLLAE